MFRMLASVGSGTLNVVGHGANSISELATKSIKSLVYSPPARVVYDDESYESVEIDVDIVRSLMGEIQRRLLCGSGGSGGSYSDENLTRLFRKIEPFFWNSVEDVEEGAITGSFVGGVEHLVGLKLCSTSEELVFPTDCHKLSTHNGSGGSKLKEVTSANSSNFIEEMYKRDSQHLHSKVNSPEKAINTLTCSKKILTAIAKSFGTNVRYFVVLKKWRDYRSEGKYIISPLERSSVKSRSSNHSHSHTLPLQIHHKYDSYRQVDKVVAAKMVETVGTFGSIRSFLNECGGGGEVEVHMSGDQTVLTVLRYRRKI